MKKRKCEVRTKTTNVFMCELEETRESCNLVIKQHKKNDFFTLEEFVEKVNDFLKENGKQLKIEAL